MQAVTGRSTSKSSLNSSAPHEDSVLPPPLVNVNIFIAFHRTHATQCIGRNVRNATIDTASFFFLAFFFALAAAVAFVA